MHGVRHRLTYRLRLLDEWQAFLLCFLAGAASSLAFAPRNLMPILLVSLPLLFLLLEAAAGRRHSIFRAFGFGYGYSMAGTYWIAYALTVDVEKFGWLIPVSIIGLSAVMAIPFVALGLLFWWRRCGHTTCDLLRFIVLWVLIEYLRSLGMLGFPWNLLGHATTPLLPVAQLAGLVGSYGLSLLVAFVALTPVVWIRRGEHARGAIAYSGAAALLLAGAMYYGAGHIPARWGDTGTRLRLVQPNIPQRMKWTQAGRIESLRIHAALSQLPPEGAPPAAIVWSETAMPFTLYARSEWPQRLRTMIPADTMLITGAVRADEAKDLRIWNSIVAIDANGVVRDSYDKHQLVPFGEFVPLRQVLPLEKITPGAIDFSRGSGARSVAESGMPAYSPLVCYEVIFPWIAVDTKARPTWLLNLTNDAWYGDSPGPYQHFTITRMRAIEQGLPMVRVANTGISGVIDPFGRVVRALPLNTRGILDIDLPSPAAQTFYATHGEQTVLLILAILWLITTVWHRSQKS